MPDPTRTLAMVGYGKMGKRIEQFAEAHGFTVAIRLDEYNNSNFEGITREAFRNVDVAIDFSVPSAVVENVERIADLGVNIVIGTTGWLEQLHYIRKIVEKSDVGLVWSPNYSIGVNAFFRIVSEAARLLADENQYECWAYEIHHSAKKDAPSGTLLKLIDDMKNAGFDRNIDVASNRAGAHPGTHEIGFDCESDTITLQHFARNRDGFAHGALKAAQWLVGKKGFYEFGEILFR